MKREALPVGIVALAIDQVTKILIETFIGLESSINVIPGFFSITCLYNTGAAFSILEGKTWFLSLLSIAVFILLLKVSKDFKDTKMNGVAFGLLIGGIFGNFADRVFLGSVRDFLKFKIFGYNFPVFNVADICIVVGILLLMISMYKEREKSDGSKSSNRRKDKTR